MTTTSKRLSVCEIFKTFGDATKNSRNIKEGEALLNAGHLILCGIKDISDVQIHIVGLCLQTSSLKSSPHEILGTFKIGEDNDCTIENVVCSCKAGLGEKCKHIAALLLQCTRIDLSTLELVSATDLKCVWKERKEQSLEKYQPQPLSEYDCLKTRKVEMVGEHMQDKLRNYFISNVPTSAISIHKNRVNRNAEAIEMCEGVAQKIAKMPEEQCSRVLSNAGTQIREVAQVSFINRQVEKVFSHIEESKFLEQFHNVMPHDIQSCCKNFILKQTASDAFKIACEAHQGDKIWAKERQFRITGSRCYEIFTFDGDSNAWEFKAKKYFYPKGFSSKQTEHGKNEKKNALQAYMCNNKLDVLVPSLIICKKMPWIAYSPDGVVFKNGQPFRLLEIKCPYSGRSNSAENFSGTSVFGS